MFKLFKNNQNIKSAIAEYHKEFVAEVAKIRAEIELIESPVRFDKRINETRGLYEIKVENLLENWHYAVESWEEDNINWKNKKEIELYIDDETGFIEYTLK